jgi:putative transposase
MLRDSTVIPFRQPEAIDDPLSEVAREGARRMLAQVLIAEARSFVAMWKDLKLPDGRGRVVRHGHGPHRAIQTRVGPVEVRRAKVRDRGEVSAEEKIRFTSSILPKWRGGRRVSMRCCRFSTCVGCRPATSRRCSPPSWARMRRTYRQR